MIPSAQEAALKIITRLRKAGFTALIAGGWVRDYLLGHPSQDIDIATNAHPEQVMDLFPRAIPVGVQFGVVRVSLDSHEYEIATFRSDLQYVDGRRPSHVDLHSSPEEDAKRRDFTINGMFFDPLSNTVLDYVGGQEDLRNKCLRAIGNPLLRFKEDRLRIVRAIRFKNTFRFAIEPKTWEAICQESTHVKKAVSPERLWQELQKMLVKGILETSLHDMIHCSLLQNLFPALSFTPIEELHTIVAALRHYKGTSLVAAICLLFRKENRMQLNQLGEEYPLSRTETKIVCLFSQYNDFSHRLTDTRYAHEYATQEFWEYLQAVACLRKNPRAFLLRHKKRMKALSFWIAQMKKNSYLVSGDDLKKIGVAPGKEMGKLLRKVFEYSIENRITSKPLLLSWAKQRI